MDGMLKNPNENKEVRSAESVTETCRQIMKSLHLNLSVEGKEEDGDIHINIAGEDRPYLLSNSASLLNSIEYLLNRIFRSGRDEGSRIMIDADGYRQHREAELTLLAQMASQKVLALRKPLGLQPMTPRERRIVHLALAEIDGVHTKSAGEGENRSITIFPS
ncbi:MAG: R3H domain-containing nucleic acid-binding protein [Acidobacteriota bacterium]|jgi:spoIIIJ-associated protein